MGMPKRQKNLSLILVLSAAFIDYLGVGLVFPIFGLLFFDPHSTLLPLGTSAESRGLWMGLLVATAPAIMFFSQPFLGTLSDSKGRRRILILSLGIGIFSYILAIIGVLKSQIILLLLSRILYGFSAGSMTVVQAAIVDLSKPEEKTKNFGLYNMALGAGFSFGPFLGGMLIRPTLEGWLNYSTPFTLALILTIANWFLIWWKFKETHFKHSKAKVDWAVGISHVKKAFQMKELRVLFGVMFLFFFGWDFFVEFISVFLLRRYDFTPTQIGVFYAYNSILYALYAGILIRPIIKRFKPKHILEAALIFGGAYFFVFLAVKTGFVMWIFQIPLIYAIALVYPTATTVISNDVSREAQGEILGIYNSIQSVALIVSPFFAGSIIGNYPHISIIVAGSCMLLGGVILYFYRLRRVRN